MQYITTGKCGLSNSQNFYSELVNNMPIMYIKDYPQESRFIISQYWSCFVTVKNKITITKSFKYLVPSLNILSVVPVETLEVINFLLVESQLSFWFGCRLKFFCDRKATTTSELLKWRTDSSRCLRKTLKTSNLQHVIKVRNACNYTIPIVQKHTRTTSQA